jgi:Mg2+ and Co2+ transporter CorA
VPTAEELSEIETTSRLQVDHGALYMTVPLILATGDEPWITVPTGFVLSKAVLLTVRFFQSAIFDSVKKELNVERLEPSLAYVRDSKSWLTIWRICSKQAAKLLMTPRMSSSGERI